MRNSYDFVVKANGSAFQAAIGMDNVHPRRLDPKVPNREMPIRNRLRWAAMKIVSSHGYGAGMVATQSLHRLGIVADEAASMAKSVQVAQRWGWFMIVLGVLAGLVNSVFMDDTANYIAVMIWTLIWVAATVCVSMLEDRLKIQERDARATIEVATEQFQQYSKFAGDHDFESLMNLMRTLGLSEWTDYVDEEDDEVFVEAAEKVLVSRAKRVLLAERPDLRYRGYKQEDAKEMRRLLAIVFSQFYEYGLVEDDWTPFFDKAEEELEAAKKID